MGSRMFEAKPKSCYVEFPRFGRVRGLFVPDQRDETLAHVRVFRYDLPLALRSQFDEWSPHHPWLYLEGLVPLASLWKIEGAPERV